MYGCRKDTIDTPHAGSKDAWLRWIAEKNNGDLDQAIFLFGPDGVEYLQSNFPPEKIAKTTRIFLISSERLNPIEDVRANKLVCYTSLGLGCLVPVPRKVETGHDDVVTVDSQKGIAGSNVRLLSTFRRTRRGNFYNNFHGAILEKEVIWQDLYQQKVRPTLLGLIPSSTTGSLASLDQTAARASAVSLAVTTENPPLPPANSLQIIKLDSGKLTAQAPSSSLSFTVEGGKDLTVNFLSRQVNPILALSGPNSTSYTATSVNRLDSLYEINQDLTGVNQSFLIRNPPAGNWTVSFVAPSVNGTPSVPVTGATWEASIGLRSPITLGVEIAESGYLVGESLKVTASANRDGIGLTGLTVNASFKLTTGITATNFTLFDDGSHDDGAANDGVYGGSQVLNTVGSFDLTVTASGNSPLGAFQRQQAGTITVGTPETTISGDFTESAPDADNDGRYDSINWSFAVNVPRAGSYTVFGDLAAEDGSIVGSASASVNAAAAGNQNVTLVFAGQEIYRNGKEGPYLLKNLRITVATVEGERLSGRPAQTALTGGPYWSWLSFERAETPSLIWQAPVLEQVTRGGSYDLRWLFKDGNGGATVDLYYDTTGSGFAGTAIATGLNAVNGEMSYNWNVGALPDGLYYVYARFRNGDFSDAVYGGSVRKITDTDGDGMPDAWETANGLNPNSEADAYLDADGDGLANLDEYIYNTNPRAADTDGGGESDLSEVTNGRDPLTASDDTTGITLLAISPGQGDSRGGDQVMVLGSGFQNGATVSFGGVAAPGVTFINSTKLLVTTPAHAVGLTSVTVTNPASGGSATKNDSFDFLFQFIEPPIAGSNGPVCAGATLNLVASTISGAIYSWAGPNGFTSGQQNPSIPSATTAASGAYTVTVTIPGHTFPPATTNVVVNPIPTTPTITAPASVLTGTTGLVASVANHAGAFYNWTITNGAITAGQGTSQITFTAGAAGVLTLQVVETNSGGCQSSTGSKNVVVCPVITVNPETISAGTIGSPYNQTFTQTGGGGAITFSVSAGALPAGLNLSATGVLSGTSTMSGNFNFTVRATDANNCFGERSYALTINPCPTIIITPGTLPGGAVGAAYNQTLTATGGTPPRNFSLDAGSSLAPGLALSPGGVISGAPTTAGSFNFTVKVTDQNGCTATKAYTLVICATITITPSSLPSGFAGAAYNQTLTQTGGVGTINWSVSAGALPGGLSLGATAGVLSGAPAAQGTFTFTITATDANNCFGDRNYTLVISGAGLMFYPLARPIRLLDTRPGELGCDAPGQPIQGGASRTQLARRTCDGLTIPANAAAITGNITTVQSGGGYLTLYPSDAAQPLVANSNYNPNEILNNVFTVGLGAADGAFNIFVTSTTHIVVDVTGYYAPPGAGGLYFHPLAHPVRLLETRDNPAFPGCYKPNAPLPGNVDSTQQATGVCDGLAIPIAAIGKTHQDVG